VGVINYPEGVGVDASGRLLVADTWNDRILLCDDTGKPTAAFGKTGQKKGELLRPRSVTTDASGNIYVVDTWNHRVEKFSRDGRFLLTFGSKGGPWGYDEAPGKFVYPYGVAVDSKGNILVSDFNNNRIHKFDNRGKFVLMWGIEGRQDGQFSHPAGVAIDKQDRLYVADLGNDRVQRFAFNEKGQAVFDGKWGEEGTDPGQFDRPYSVCVDQEGNFYVSDFGNHRIQVFSPSGSLLYICGKRGSGDGELESPLGAAVDGKGALWVLDWGNNRLQEFARSS
jgi:DNA-binding beta-propeller fold protein YncE